MMTRSGRSMVCSFAYLVVLLRLVCGFAAATRYSPRGGRRRRRARSRRSAIALHSIGPSTGWPEGLDLLSALDTLAVRSVWCPPTWSEGAIQTSSCAASRSGYGELVAVDDIDLEVQPGEFLALLGPVRLRQDHDPADDRRLRRADRGRDRDRRPLRRRHPPEQAQRQHRLPGLRAVPAHDACSTTSRTGSSSARSARRSATARRRGARARPPHRARDGQAGAALGRHAAARRARPRAR